MKQRYKRISKQNRTNSYQNDIFYLFIYAIQQLQLTMINQFMNTLKQGQKDYYQKINHIVGINLNIQQNNKKKIKEIELNNEEMYDFCRFNDGQSFPVSTVNKIQKYRENSTGNSCLHIASEYSNLNMMKFIIKNKILNPNDMNKLKDNPLIHTLKHSTHERFEEAILYLIKHSDLNIQDRMNKYPYEIQLPIYTKSRVRILQILREQFFKGISKR